MSVSSSPISSAINRTLKRRSLSRTAFTRATLFSFLEVEGRPSRCSSSMLSLPSLNAFCHLRTWAEERQHPHKLSSTTAMLWNQIFRVSCRTSSRNAAPDSSAFSPVTRHKNYYALCQCTDCYKGADSTEEGQTTWVPPPLASTPTFLSWPFCTAQKNHSHYFWERPCNHPGISIVFTQPQTPEFGMRNVL